MHNNSYISLTIFEISIFAYINVSSIYILNSQHHQLTKDNIYLLPGARSPARQGPGRRAGARSSRPREVSLDDLDAVRPVSLVDSLVGVVGLGLGLRHRHRERLGPRERRAERSSSEPRRGKLQASPARPPP